MGKQHHGKKIQIMAKTMRLQTEETRIEKENDRGRRSAWLIHLYLLELRRLEEEQGKKTNVMAKLSAYRVPDCPISFKKNK
jgi:hypothetical protein